MVQSYLQVMRFWFDETEPRQHWVKDPKFDAQIRDRFLGLHGQASAGELSPWRTTMLGRLAEIIILDQFSRNLYRESPRSLSQDGMALVLAQEAIGQSAVQELALAQRSFLYMPFMHSESLFIHRQAVQLFSEPGMQENLKFEMDHFQIIERFGRYPHRNLLLNRDSTPEELEFLTQPGSYF